MSQAPANKDGKSEAQTPPYVDYAAEAEFSLLDDEITAKWDVPSKHTYTGAVPDILGTVDAKTGAVTKKGKYQLNAEEANKYDLLLENQVV